MNQLSLPLHINNVENITRRHLIEVRQKTRNTYRERLIFLLSQNLNFCHNNGNHGAHTFHSFPAKFPPELPRACIQELTNPGDIVLDPMSGSGTTIVEAFLASRCGIGFDIDPLALLISQVKVAQLDTQEVKHANNTILIQATDHLRSRRAELQENLQTRWDKKTKEFIDYWFASETQLELLALITEIEQLPESPLKSFFTLIFSAIIITKSGGVSFAIDLAHTRPHRAKLVTSKQGTILLDERSQHDSPRKIEILTKTLRSPLDDFGKRFQQNVKHLVEPTFNGKTPSIEYGNAQALPLDDASVDLIVTSPPYASNAIDYMRAHKFSLVWMGYPIDQLSQTRKRYIGGESVTGVEFEELPPNVTAIVKEVAQANRKKGNVLRRYYSEMTRTLREMLRVLKPGKAAIVVVGNSILGGKDTHIQRCLAEIGTHLGFEVPKIGVRELDRNRRMLPVSFQVDSTSLIQQRMHEEYILGFYKPEE